MDLVKCLCVSIFLFLSNSEGFSQSFSWMKHIKNGRPLAKIAIDEFDNMVICGDGSNSVDFGDTVITFPNQSAFIAKLDPFGNLIWVERDTVATAVSSITDVAVDSFGNVFFVGKAGSISNNNVTSYFGYDIDSSYSYDAFLGKVDYNGNLLWLNPFRGSGMVTIQELALSTSGISYILGYFDQNITLGGQTIIGQGNDNFFLARISPAGTIDWVQQIESSYWQSTHLAIDPYGNAYVNRKFLDSILVGSLTYYTSNPNFFHLLTVKYDSIGNILWVRNDPPPFVFVSDIDCDGAGNLYIVGDPGSNCLWDTTTISNPTGEAVTLIKVDPNGNFLWAEMGGGGGSTDEIFSLHVEPNGDAHVVARLSGSAIFGNFIPPSYPQGPTSGLMTLVKYDSSGILKWGAFAAAFQRQSGPDDAFPTGLGVDSRGNIYIAGTTTTSCDFQGIQLNLSSTSWQMFITKIVESQNLITGTVFRDLSNDGMIDTIDPGFPGIVIEGLPGPRYYLSDPINGGYVAQVDTGSYSFDIPNIPPYHSLTTTAPHTATFNNSGNTDSLNHFGLFPTPGISDLRIEVTAMAPARPGGLVNYQVACKNIGTDTISGTVYFRSDTRFQYLFNPSNLIGDTIFWAFSNLTPQESRIFQVPLQLVTLPTVNLGDTLCSNGWVEPMAGDVEPVNNRDTTYQIVIGSFDPNDKSANPIGDISPANIAMGTWIEYLIRFQNTGNDTAFSVIIRDTLDPNLNVSSFEMLDASHNYQISLNGVGNLEWRFQNILLPDSNVNELRSHGFIKYRIRPKTSLTIGETIENDANIYFDFNPPITTNTTLHTVLMPTFTEPLLTGPADHVTIFPNPTKGNIQIRLNLSNATVSNVEIFDLQGHMVNHTSLNVGIGMTEYGIGLGMLQKGGYLFRITIGEEVFTKKIILQ